MMIVASNLENKYKVWLTTVSTRSWDGRMKKGSRNFGVDKDFENGFKGMEK
jgi:hypothetical protein